MSGPSHPPHYGSFLGSGDTGSRKKITRPGTYFLIHFPGGCEALLLYACTPEFIGFF